FSAHHPCRRQPVTIRFAPPLLSPSAPPHPRKPYPPKAASLVIASPGEMSGHQKGGEIEAGTSGGTATAPAQVLYPGMAESPELRWALIRKIYVILSLQLLLTAVVAAVVVKVRAIPHFFVSSYAGLGVYIFILIFPFIGENSSYHHLFCYEFVYVGYQSDPIVRRVSAGVWNIFPSVTIAFRRRESCGC
uniref:Uncharacterized protein n=2 Tax=Aegilops tauschii subsp. strangulata TaxID=200361 RepID=A0A453GLG7_AEGTS